MLHSAHAVVVRCCRGSRWGILPGATTPLFFIDRNSIATASLFLDRNNIPAQEVWTSQKRASGDPCVTLN